MTYGLCFAALDSRKYETVGRILAYSIVHRGPLPNFLSETLYSSICLGTESTQPGLSDIQDPDLAARLQQVITAILSNS